MNKKEFLASIEWWKDDTLNTFDHSIEQMIELGISEKKAVSIAEDLYYATSNEYGN